MGTNEMKEREQMKLKNRDKRNERKGTNEIKERRRTK
jgi:hypothetical protein